MLLIIVPLTIFLIYSIKLWQDTKKLPKGPSPLPIIGNIHQVTYKIWKNGGIVDGFREIVKEHGKVFTIWIGPLPTVYICDYEIAHETHVKKANTFGARWASGSVNYIREGRGLLASNGEFGQEHRRFALTTLRNFGLGRNIMEAKIMDELQYRLNDFKKNNSKNGIIETQASVFFDLLIGSIINQLLVSERFEQNDPSFEALKKCIADGLENFSLVDMFIPQFVLNSKYFSERKVRTLSPFKYIHGLGEKAVEKRVDQIRSGKHQIDEGGSDFIDAYLEKIEKDKQAGIESTFNYETLAIDYLDLWFGGQETTSTTLCWAGACFLNHPEVVKKARSEILETTGGTRSLSLTDRPSTPYLNATINEVQRIASILNMNLFRITDEDSTVDGQPLKGGTAVTTQLSLMHADEEVFENSEEFNPDRYFKNPGLEKQLIPFGIGKRACIGESLARAELYLIIGNLILNYDMEPVDDKIPEIRSPTPFSIFKRSPIYNMRFVEVK